MYKNNITCSEAREISLFHFLKESGINPVKLNDKEAWYISPFRDEKTASFKVSLEKNVWYDFGEGSGGSLIDFIMYTQHCDIPHALYVISNSQRFNHLPKRKNERTVDKGGFQIVSVGELKAVQLLRYIEKRSIDVSIAKKYCHEVFYGFRKRIFFAVGFKSNGSGIELRSLHFKGSYSRKNYTIIKNNSKTIIVFEGFFDFLSYLTINGDNKAKDYLILNSVALVEKALTPLEEYENIVLFLDNDNAGNKATLKIQEKFPSAEDRRNTYKKFNDLNEYLIDLSNLVR
jgi:DNA primase